MKDIALLVVVLLVAITVSLLSLNGYIHPLSAPAYDPRRETELKLRGLIQGTFSQKHPDVVDLWGTTLRITEKGDLRLTTSAGPDKTFDTIDDEQYSSAVPR